MAIHSQPHDPDWYLRDPRTRKWLIQCVTCQRVGYRVDAPEEFFGRQSIRHNFQPLALDDSGRCAECKMARSLAEDTNSSSNA